MGLFEKAEDKSKEAVGTSQQKFGQAVDSPEHEAKGAVKKYTAQGCDVLHDSMDTIKANPVATVAVAAGIGFVFGYLLGKK
ncbi:DUF883 family protein [Moellerella wisconsensis]|uniref:Uncharacterized DUF883 family protein n=1 Tax=Moellerella wisconsensis ATCC 35017 TaxID=1354267 RepID=A0A0N1KI46_9GAMM|nr:DUF883 family protein [Moellerella wisconsensis]KPD02054.1 uncharacterized DUF883 family protein [Moellerella wisconsensis ATCC 35017]VFS54262.1 Bacterial protein of uncharacterised function (DUF883) [Moellerella wisconsensis]